MEVPMKIIARVYSDFASKFGIPRQAGLVPALRSVLVWEPEFRNPDMIRGLEGFSHIWIIWNFSANRQSEWSPTVRPPRLGGNQRMGVFATRAPYRPNPIGLSCVRLVEIQKNTPHGPVLILSGADLMNGTPVFDIKPYAPYADCHPEATGGFTEQNDDFQLKVDFPPALLAQIPRQSREALLGILAQDPRPAYQHDPLRTYGVSFGGYNIRFRVQDKCLAVCQVEPVTVGADPDMEKYRRVLQDSSCQRSDSDV